ncbi:hypothetical protein K503DRAFT_634284 [Rhizopogon vinicolor AM-OR11-026]|uniref:Uncharacterized protein n=1 Tax=Rhizopogon vinicolor AM-OR11-026 TaxID=1314800 RepID=A0A1B7N5W4_9AGAM|nr:hypothetical protein K503DRAFT_634284 [Rhizopogon vinicolor AM-OR11-026]
MLLSCFPRTNPSFAKFENKNSVETDGLCNAYNNFAMSKCGEACPEKYDINLESLDEYVIESYKSA